MNPISLENKSKEELLELHQALETRLEELRSAKSLSAEESFEMQVIKKRKLAIKDLLQSLE